MTSNLDISLTPINGSPRTLQEWLTNFHLVMVALDPFKYESAWILETASRILKSFSGADCRIAWIVAGTKENTEQFLGPLSKEILTFYDADRSVVKSLGIEHLPALIHINQAAEILGKAEGWIPGKWREVIAQLTDTMNWKSPLIPKPGDPVAFEGSPV